MKERYMMMQLMTLPVYPVLMDSLGMKTLVTAIALITWFYFKSIAEYKLINYLILQEVLN